jgi:hypothetical protein
MHVLRKQLLQTARHLTGARVLAARLYGVGPITGLALTCWLAGKDRFSSSAKAVRFTGLDIKVHSSDRKGPPGRLSRQGPPVLRWAVYEAGKTHARSSAPDHGYYTAVKDRKNSKRAALSEAARSFGRPVTSWPSSATTPSLPPEFWPDWAVRVTGVGAHHGKFLPAALIALLLPHSDMPLNQVTVMVSGQLRRHVTGYHMGKLTAGALRILTELAFAIDAHDIPIGYRRRRDLAASATLIDDATWARMTREAGMRLAPVGIARRHLYELLTECGLGTAPPPYQLTSAGSHTGYNDFVLGMPASLTTALADHAQCLLADWGIADEPLQWQPPDDWVSTTTWPGADPARTDPAPIHHALLHEDTPPAQIAADLGISLDHLRQVLRRHPLPRPHRPVRYTLIPRSEPATWPLGQQPGVIYLDPAWLREEYLTWHRSLDHPAPFRHRDPDPARPATLSAGPRLPRPPAALCRRHTSSLWPRAWFRSIRLIGQP